MAYLQGALHDGTRSNLHNTHRITQRGRDWLERLRLILGHLNSKSWIYREGKCREVYALETTAKFLDVNFDPDNLLSDNERVSYVRGYFDAEGGMPQSLDARFYIQFTQKDFIELAKVKCLLEHFDMNCGEIHNPSAEVDPNYWRFYVKSASHKRFAQIVGSWHPRKEKIFVGRKMI
jgi:hypothetical protein